jgi:hypothetical protein
VVNSYSNNVVLGNGISLQATVTNTGNTVWIKDKYNLRCHGYLPNGTRIQELVCSGYVLPRLTVLPGESVTMYLTISTGPNTQLNRIGTGQIGIDMVQEGVAWFGNEVKKTVKMAQPLNKAKIVITSSNPASGIFGIVWLQKGRELILNLNVTNTGNTTWVPNIFNLRCHGYLPNGAYIRDLRCSGFVLPWFWVLPGKTASMQLRIPTGKNTQLNTTGTCVIGVDMVQEGVAWFGNEVKKVVKIL